MNVEDYDPITCITAGELRQMGLAVDPSIPDVGWIPRGAMVMTCDSVTGDAESKTMVINSSVTFTQPFKWVVVDIVVENGPQDA